MHLRLGRGAAALAATAMLAASAARAGEPSDGQLGDEDLPLLEARLTKAFGKQLSSGKTAAPEMRAVLQRLGFSAAEIGKLTDELKMQPPEVATKVNLDADPAEERLWQLAATEPPAPVDPEAAAMGIPVPNRETRSLTYLIWLDPVQGGHRVLARRVIDLETSAHVPVQVETARVHSVTHDDVIVTQRLESDNFVVPVEGHEVLSVARGKLDVLLDAACTPGSLKLGGVPKEVRCTPFGSPTERTWRWSAEAHAYR